MFSRLCVIDYQSTAMAQKLNIVVFGATGFTGKYIILMLSKLSKKDSFTWGVAGRSESKLKDVLEECGKQLGENINHLPKIVADVKNEKSLKEMARQAHIIINSCGPFNYYGEPVVKACVEEGAHHIDLSAETQYMEEMQLKYHKQAQEKGVYIISACAFASVPVDLGIMWMQEKLGGTLNSVEAYLEYWEEGEAVSGGTFNYSTWESILHSLIDSKKIEETRQKLFPEPLPKFEPVLKLKALPHKPKALQGWAFPFDAMDRPVVNRTQRLLYHKHSKRPIQVETYFALKTFMQVVIMTFFSIVVLILSKFSCGQKLLFKYPETFSAGYITHETPSVERIEKVRFSFTLCGQGWKEKLPDATHQHLTPPNKAITVEVTGRNPGYGAAATFAVLAAIVMHSEVKKLPTEGGVYTPGYVFANTSLVERLNENEINFDVLMEEDLK